MKLRCIVLIVSVFATSNFHGMDDVKKADDTPAEWLQLSYDVYAGKVGLFHKLPPDIQAYIFSLIHPKPILDDWQTNNAVCLQQVVTPYPVTTFDAQGERMAYFSKRKGTIDDYAPHWVNFTTGINHSLCKKGNNSGYKDTLPEIALCGEILIFKDSETYLYAVRLFEKDTTCSENIARISPTKVSTWTCHPNLPLCAMTETLGASFETTVYEFDGLGNRQSEYFKNILTFAYEPPKLQWHYSQPYLAITNYLRMTTNNDKNIFHSLKTKDHSNSDFNGTAYFSLNDINVVFLKYEEVLKQHNMLIEKHSIIPLKNLNFILHGVGHDFFLAENQDTNGSGDNTFELRSFDDKTTIPMTTFNKPNGLHKLPTAHDNRYITIENHVAGGSLVSIYQPLSHAQFHHYCIFQAALKAQETNLNWELFKQAGCKRVVIETAQYYAVFKKIMNDRGILNG